MSQGPDEEQVYRELRLKAVAMFGEQRAIDLEDFLRATAGQVADIINAGTDPDMEPLFQE